MTYIIIFVLFKNGRDLLNNSEKAALIAAFLLQSIAASIFKSRLNGFKWFKVVNSGIKSAIFITQLLPDAEIQSCSLPRYP